MKNKIYSYRELIKFACQIEFKERVETKDILMRKDETNWSVAHRLAFHSLTWTTDIPEVLVLTDSEGTTVEDALIEKDKI